MQQTEQSCVCSWCIGSGICHGSHRFLPSSYPAAVRENCTNWAQDPGLDLIKPYQILHYPAPFIQLLPLPTPRGGSQGVARQDGVYNPGWCRMNGQAAKSMFGNIMEKCQENDGELLLSRVAHKTLWISASSAASEWILSTVGNVVASQRSQLKPDKIDWGFNTAKLFSILLSENSRSCFQ